MSTVRFTVTKADDDVTEEPASGDKINLADESEKYVIAIIR